MEKLTPHDILSNFILRKYKSDKIVTTKQLKNLSLYNDWKESTFTRKFREYISKNYIEVEKLTNDTWYLKKIKE